MMLGYDFQGEVRRSAQRESLLPKLPMRRKEEDEFLVQDLFWSSTFVLNKNGENSERLGANWASILSEKRKVLSAVSLLEKIISFELFYHKILFIYHLVLVLVQTARRVRPHFEKDAAVFKVLTFDVSHNVPQCYSTRSFSEGSQ